MAWVVFSTRASSVPPRIAEKYGKTGHI
jgi:hypothetical protein